MVKKIYVEDKVAEIKKDDNVVLTDFSTVKDIFTGHMDAYYPYLLKLYKNFYMYSVDRFDELGKTKETWRTNIKSPLTHTYTSAVYNMLIQASIEFFVIDKKGENNKLADEMLTLADYIKDKEEYTGQWESIAFDVVLLGTGIGTSYFVDYTIKSAYIDQKGLEQIVMDVSQYPMMRYTSGFNFMRYGSQTHVDKRYDIERKLVPLNNLRSEYQECNISEETMKKITEGANYISQYDFDSIKAYMPYYSMSTQLGVSWGDGAIGPGISQAYKTKGFRNILGDDTFSIKGSKMVEVVEAKTFYYKTIYANGVSLGTIPTKGPYKRGEHVTCAFKTSPGLFTGLGIGHVVAPIQDAFDAILNTRIDNVKLSVNSMYLQDSTMSLFGNSQNFTTRPGGIIKVSNMDGFKPLQTKDVSQSAYQETDAMFGMVQGAVAISAPAIGIQQKVERVAAGPEMLKTAADNQLAPLLRNMEKFMGQMFKRFIVLAKTYMNESELKKILGNDCEFCKVDLNTIINDYDYTFNISSPQLDLNQARRMQLFELLKFAQEGKANGTPTDLDTNKLSKAIVESFSLPMDLSLSPEQMKEVIGNTDKMIGAVEKATGKSAGTDPIAAMRAAQGQGVPIPPEMTTNGGGANGTTPAVVTPYTPPETPVM